ncbi:MULTISPECIES: alpha/beta hydrolase [unclassified Pedobacter]|uniref:alpha/beta hydrolase n=1 Tax=unclassified Pedobacter TaxID=2628915 RepID=UPI0014246033|nr:MULTISPECIES: alpha/beta hydrolase [unclassified Pedobacter]NII85384.1 proline iminopeptidase [Pedobacter sp. SG908]NMN39701.1 proline iminopeptidase [Pedobacter sp. SG918]
MKIICIFSILLTGLFSSCSSSDSALRLKVGNQTILTSDTVKLSVKVAGKGLVCIYLHGGPGQDFLSFEKMGGANLEKCLTMVYLDQRGSGHSQNAKDYSLNRIVRDIEELRIKLGVEKVYLLSHSFGGILAINYALKYPEHLSGIIMANTIAHFMNPNQVKEQIEYGYQLLKKDTTINETDFKKLMDEAALVRKKLSTAHLGYKYIANDVNTIIKMDSIESSYKRTSDFGMTLFMPLVDSTKVQHYPEYFRDYALLTGKINIPALIITGKEDHAVGPDYYKNYRFPNQKVAQIDGSHMLYYEKNKEFTTAVCAFVK